MKRFFLGSVFISILISCNASHSEVGTEKPSKVNDSMPDSAMIVESHNEWQRLLSLDKLTKRSENNPNFANDTSKVTQQKENSMKEVTLGAGCFWCIEACFQDVKGIVSVVPGYAGGQRKNPTYEQICSGATGHAEVARIIYDENVISFDELLEMFWFVHDPTQLNRQGNDIGTQYRSVIFYHDEEQKAIAEKYKARLTEEKVWDKPIVTEIVAINNYYEAEKYHHDYLNQNPENAYCRAIVRPKVDKFKKVFESKLED